MSTYDRSPALSVSGLPEAQVARYLKGSLLRVERIVPPIAGSAETPPSSTTPRSSETLLTKPEAPALLGDNEVRNILLGQTLEESGPKAVAYDVFRAVGGSERRRPGFHPDDHDATELLARWTQELFREQGRLTDHLR